MTSLASILTLANQISKPLTHPPCSTHMRDKPWPFQCQQCFEIIILIDKVYIDISIWDDRLSVRYILQHLSNTSERIINTAENNCQKYDRTNQNCMVHCHCFVCRTYTETVAAHIYCTNLLAAHMTRHEFSVPFFFSVSACLTLLIFY